MNPLVVILLASWLAGLASFLGGLLARLESTPNTLAKQEFIHSMVAMGGGVLLAAVAFALVPAGINQLSPWLLALSFLAGGICFCYLDVAIARRGGAKAQFMAMLVDFIPEAISLGAVFSHDQKLGFLLAAFIGAQNLPEGFNSYRELLDSGSKPRSAISTLLAVSIFGPIAAALGYFLLQDHEQLTAAIMTFAGGGILYLVFQDIAPQAKFRRHWLPPLGAVLGFLLGAIGKQLCG